MPTIPASSIVNVTPGVVAAGGNALSLIGTILTQNTRVPIGAVQSFASAQSVSNFFGPTAKEALLASVYFGGFNNSTVQPGALLFAQYPSSAVAAYIRGGSTASLTLAQLQALSGTLSLLVDGYNRIASSINLSSATSFSSAAGLIQTGLNASLPVLASGTGSITSGTLTVSSLGVGAGLIAIGQTVAGTGVTASTIITGQLTGAAGGTGTYSVSISQTAISEALSFTGTAVAVTFDSVSQGFIITSGITGVPSSTGFGTGTLATSLFLTQLSGAVLSQGAAAATPIAFMNSVIAVTQNWATFMLAFDPDGGVGNAQKLLFSQWTSQQNNRYMFVCWDTDPNPSNIVPATTSLGYLIGSNGFGYSGTFLIWQPSDLFGAAFVCGLAASINFNATNGRVTFAFRYQAGLLAGVTSQQVASNLIANGYNFMGAYGTANQNFVFLYPGSVSGSFNWADSYINQIWLNSQFQLALITFMQQVNSIPYNPAGNAQIEAALYAAIQAGLNFGAYRIGVTLSAAQSSAVNTAAGSNITLTLQQQGWYLQVLPATAAVRAARQSPPCNFWYTDGEAVQQINLASINVQ